MAVMDAPVCEPAIEVKPVSEREVLIARWTKALRSGKIEQCTGRLVDTQGRACALGVFYAHVKGYEKRRLVMSAIHERKIAVMNDGGATFPEIADWIEANL